MSDVVASIARALEVELVAVLQLDRGPASRSSIRAAVGLPQEAIGTASVGVGEHSQAGDTLTPAAQWSSRTGRPRPASRSRRS